MSVEKLRAGAMIRLKRDAPEALKLEVLDGAQLPAGCEAMIHSCSITDRRPTEWRGRMVTTHAISMGIITKEEIQGFHDLQGNAPFGHGWFINSMTHKVLACFDVDIKSGVYVVKKDLIHKGRNLRGEACTVLQSFPQGGSSDRRLIVEFTKNIGGNSCDGLGKGGHCLLVSKDVLEMAKTTVDDSHNEEVSQLYKNPVYA